MRSLWKGAISFGLVNIPVRMYAATERKDVKFNYLHEPCGTPIRYEKVCPTCEREVTEQEIVWGYEYEKGRYVTLKEEDFDALPLAATSSLEILDFVDLSDIDPVYFDKSYYLEPQEGGSKAYALLRRAMAETGKIAIAKVALRTKETLAAIRTAGRVLVMETMFYPDEIRSTRALTGLPEREPELGERELHMATELVKSLTAPFDPEKYTNEYRTALMQLIEDKLAGEELVEAPPRPAAGKVVDLMAALEASLRAVQDGDQAPNGRPKPRRKAARTREKAGAGAKAGRTG